MTRRSKPLLVVGALVALAIVLLVCVIGATQRWLSPASQPPGVGTVLLAPAESKAQRVLEHETTDAESAAEYLAAQPTAYWLTPEQHPPGAVGTTTLALLAQARAEDVSLAIVVYGLPERDCGNYSEGGLAPGAYGAWVAEIARAVETAPDLRKIVILEPDSLALATECGNLDERVMHLRDAVHALSGPATWIYLDGGHSGWHSATRMASLIEAVDVNEHIRGFATNVSNYRSSGDEIEYARAVSAQLDGLHAVIDTSRNGAPTAGSQWCNPPGQRIGAAGGSFGDDVIDTNLWIKPPGESDGPCNGGPDAGIWWPEGAEALTTGRH